MGINLWYFSVKEDEMSLDYSDLNPDPWLSCRDWVTTWDGSVTEIFVLDFSSSKLSMIIDEISQRGEILEFMELHECEKFIRANTLSEAANRLVAGETQQLHFIAQVAGVRLQIYLENWHTELFSLELVFWADKVFPESQNEDHHRERFRQLIQLSLDLCQRVNGRKIILTGEWNTDPHELELAEYESAGDVIWEQ